MIRLLFAALVGATAFAACDNALESHLTYPATVPTPTPTASGSSSCPQGGTPTATATNFVLMTSAAVPATTIYGTVAGYIDNASIPTPTPQTFPAGVITTSMGTTYQFYNGDIGSVHAASGIAGSSFPASYQFLTVQTGTAFTADGNWSTGPISYNCYSQPLTASATGTFLFGDPTAYASGVRDVLVVTR